MIELLMARLQARTRDTRLLELPGEAVAWLRDILAPTLESFRRRRAIGRAPDLLSFVILQLGFTPSLECAIDFATDAIDGRLSRSLAAHRAAAVSGTRAIDGFASDWASLDPSLRRAGTLLSVAMDLPADRREETLADALDAVLEGARERVVEFSSSIRGPAMGIYAFGVMLPLALVGLLPVLASSGGGVAVLPLAVVYDLLIPVGLIGAGVWLWARRPAITDRSFESGVLSHTPSPWISLIAALGSSVLVWFVAGLLVPNWARPIAALGTGVGVGVVQWLRPALEAQTRLETLEARLPDALLIVGQRLADGDPIEATIPAVARRFDGPIADLFDRAARRRERSGEPVETAFLGQHGLLEAVPSRRVRASMQLLVTAGEHGPMGGRTLQSVGQYLDSLLGVEREARRQLAQTTSTLRQTAIVFAPAIAGVTVALATGMDSVEGTQRSLDVGQLGTVVGVYVLLLACILPALSVVLERGFDPVRMGVQSGLALAVGSLVYPLAFLAARTLVYV